MIPSIPIELIIKLDDDPEMEEYRNDNASYDDVRYEIPIEVLEEKGYTRDDLEQMNSNSHYQGHIRFVGDIVKIHGAP